jgi:lysophospholipase L1-like esterase
MATVLCFGDSNTWGYIPGTAGRYPRSVRWTGLLQASLGPEVQVIEEGMNGRTTVLEDPTRMGRCGLTYLRPCLDSHAPIDLIVLMLGTNDLKHRFGMSPADIGANVTTLLNTIALSASGPGASPPPVLLVSPVHVYVRGPLAGIFADAYEKSRELGAIYQNLARTLGTHFLDAAEVAEVSPIDGVHLDQHGHAELARAITEGVRAILGANPGIP